MDYNIDMLDKIPYSCQHHQFLLTAMVFYLYIQLVLQASKHVQFPWQHYLNTQDVTRPRVFSSNLLKHCAPYKVKYDITTNMTKSLLGQVVNQSARLTVPAVAIET